MSLHDDAEREALERLRAVVAGTPTPDLSQALSPLQPYTTPEADPEGSVATAHTLDGSWEDATTAPGARTGAPASPNLDQADAEADALRAFSRETSAPAPTMPQEAPEVGLVGEPGAVEYVGGADDADALNALADAGPEAPPVPPAPQPLGGRPEATVRPDDSMAPEDDSPDALHAMASTMADDPDFDPTAQPTTATEADPMMPGAFRSPARALGTPALPPPDERADYVTDAESADFPPTPGQMREPNGDPMLDAELDGDADDPLAALAEAEASPKPEGPRTGVGALDEGLPSEADISGARGSDTGNDILRRIGNMFRGAAGGAPIARRDAAPGLEQQRREGLSARMAAKGADRRADQSAQTAADRAAVTDERAERSLAQGERRLSLAEQTAASTADARERSATRLEGDSARRGAAADALTDPDSGSSRGARLAFEAARRTRLRGHPELGAEMDAALLAAGIDPTTATAAELDRATGIIRSIGVRGSGGGGTGTGSARAHGTAARETLSALLTESGRDARIVEGLTDAQVQSQLGQEMDQRPETGVGAGEEIIAGVRAGIPLGRGEGPRMRDGLAGLAGNYEQLGVMSRIAREHVGGGAWNPQARAEAAGARSSLMGMVSALENSGVVNEGAIPRIEEAIPDPSTASQAVLDTLDARVRAYQHTIDSAVRARLRLRSVPAEGIEEALRIIHGGDVRPSGGARATAPSAPSSPTGSAMVTVVGPRGPVRMRRDQVPARLPEGFSLQEGTP